MQKRSLWYSFEGGAYSKDALQTAFQGNYAVFLLPADKLHWADKVQLPRKMSYAMLLNSASDVKAVKKKSALYNKTEYFVCTRKSLLDKIPADDKRKKGLLINVSDKKSLLYAVEISSLVDFLIIEFSDPTNIPLELVLAKTQATRTQVIKKVKTAQDGAVSVMTMEMGSDGILLESNALDEIIRLDQEFEQAITEQMVLKPAKVTKLQHVGMGTRICIDTTSELGPDEGMLLGSTSQGGIMVCSETHYLPYMNLRPFRVNAGGIHMYAWGPDNFCAYLSDLKAGDQVLAVNSKGRARTVTVGRVKAERRPLLLIEAEIAGKSVNTFIQDDWHVRVMGSKGEIRPSAEIEPGDNLLGFLDTPGRHVGYKIDETIKEV